MPDSTLRARVKKLFNSIEHGDFCQKDCDCWKLIESFVLSERQAAREEDREQSVLIAKQHHGRPHTDWPLNAGGCATLCGEPIATAGAGRDAMTPTRREQESSRMIVCASNRHDGSHCEHLVHSGTLTLPDTRCCWCGTIFPREPIPAHGPYATSPGDR